MNGATPKWMVYFMESPIYKWMRTGGTPTSETPYDRDISCIRYIYISYIYIIYIYIIYIYIYPIINTIWTLLSHVESLCFFVQTWRRRLVKRRAGRLVEPGLPRPDPRDLRDPRDPRERPPELKARSNRRSNHWKSGGSYGFHMDFMWILELHISPCWS